MKTFDLACTVTGAAGFVGGHLVNALMDQEDYRIRVFGIDLPPTPGSRIKEGWERNGNSFSYEPWDVTQPIRSDYLAVDAVYHFAGIANPKVYLSDPIRVMDLNLKGLLGILERIILWDAHRPRIIYSSTSEVYGKNPDVPFDEMDTDMVFGPTRYRRWCYAMTKAVGEHYLQAYADSWGVRHTIFRFFNFIGPDIDAPGAGRVITQMVGDAIDTGVINVTDPGTQTRCFVHSDEFVVPLVRALTMKKATPWFDPNEHGSFDYGGPYIPKQPPSWADDYTLNLGSTDELSMMELAGIVAKECEHIDVYPQIRVTPKQEIFGQGYDDIPRRKPNVERAAEVLGWRAQRPSGDVVREAVRSAIARHRSHVGAA